MAYNALVSNFTNYAHYVLRLEIRSLPLIDYSGRRDSGTLPLPPVITRLIGRKNPILTGFAVMFTAFLLASLLIMPFMGWIPELISLIIMNVCFAVAGVGLRAHDGKTYILMFLELSRTTQKLRRGRACTPWR